MAIEYAAVLEAKSRCSVLGLLSEMSIASQVQVLSSNGSEALLKWRVGELRKDWPEDIVIAINGERVLISFYTGSQDDRKSLLTSIETAISERRGFAVVFEEL